MCPNIRYDVFGVKFWNRCNLIIYGSTLDFFFLGNKLTAVSSRLGLDQACPQIDDGVPGGTQEGLPPPFLS